MRPAGDDRTGDLARLFFFAIAIEYLCKFCLTGCIDKICGGDLRPNGVHPHIQRAVCAKGKSTLGVIELEGRDPNIQNNSINAGGAVFQMSTQKRIHVTERPMQQGDLSGLYFR